MDELLPREVLQHLFSTFFGAAEWVVEAKRSLSHQQLSGAHGLFVGQLERLEQALALELESFWVKMGFMEQGFE
jgi:hypothetical protein